MWSLLSLFVVVPTVLGTVSWARGRFGKRWWVTLPAVVVGVVLCVPISVIWLWLQWSRPRVVVVR